MDFYSTVNRVVRCPWQVWILAAVVLVSVSGCAGSDAEDTRSAFELATAGMEDFNIGDYTEAIKSFEKIRDWYPFSKYAILAELKLGDAHYKLSNYEDAINAYESFENLHPRNEATPYVIYQIGRCYFDQLGSPDREQSNATKALETFQRLMTSFPSDPHAVRARYHATDCIRSMASHELTVAKYYFKVGRFKAALARFERVIRNYPDVGVQHEALYYLESCRQAIAEMAARDTSQALDAPDPSPKASPTPPRGVVQDPGEDM